MMTPVASAYFRDLIGLLLSTQVTDRNGCAMSLDAGMKRVLELVASIVRTAKGTPDASGRKVLLVGNGGSAAIASHVQNDLCKGLGVRAIVFNEAPLLTALANDIDYASAFAKLAELWAEHGDLMVAISSSGRSENILRAVRVSAARRCRLVTFSGFRADNPLRKLGDLNFYVPSRGYGQVEVAHNALLHFVTDQAMESAAANGYGASSVIVPSLGLSSGANA